MKKTIIAFILSLVFIFALVLTACSENVDITYPDFTRTPAYDGTHKSWEYGDDGKLGSSKEEITVTWFINIASFTWNGNGSSIISDTIKNKTGVNIEFITPITDDNTKLSTMISGNSLTDILSVQCWYPEIQQMAEQGYVYPLNPLMDRWAPSFYSHLPEDVFNWYKQSDGNTYNLANYAYSSKYLNFLENSKLEPNGAIMVRKDYFDAYSASAAAVNNDPITSPRGFIQASKWVKNQFGYRANDPVVLMSEFETTGNASLTWLQQYFSVPFEDSAGEYISRQDHPLNDEMLLFVNELYREGLITTANLSDNHDQVASYIAKGTPFVTMCTPQNYGNGWISAKNNNIEYVPLLLTNSNGDTPILQDISGLGYMGIMINSKAKRPDRIIKLLEFLYSEEGQRLISFGVEGDSWEWKEQPTKTSLGKVEWTTKYMQDFKNGDTGKYGFGASMLADYLYYILIRPTSALEANTLYLENLKKPLIPYSYRVTASFLKFDSSDAGYKNYIKKSTAVSRSWVEKYPEIISASSAAECKEKIAQARSTASRKGSAVVYEYQKQGYRNSKAALNITWGWPPNDPSFVAPVLKVNGDASYYMSYNN